MMLKLVFTQCHSAKKSILPFKTLSFILKTFLATRYYYDNTLSLFSAPTLFSGEVKASWAVSQQHLLRSFSVQRRVLNHCRPHQPVHHTHHCGHCQELRAHASGAAPACLIPSQQFLFTEIGLGCSRPDVIYTLADLFPADSVCPDKPQVSCPGFSGISCP